MHYEVRLASSDDVRSLARVEREAGERFLNHFRQTGLTGELLLQTTSEHQLRSAQQAARLWVAIAPGGEVVGFASVSDVGGYAHLDELDVLPTHGKAGVGSRLLAAVCEWAENAGYAAVTLATFRDVSWNAPFYQRRGFQVVSPSELSDAHVELVAAEARRGLRTDLRVVMARRSKTGPQ